MKSFLWEILKEKKTAIQLLTVVRNESKTKDIFQNNFICLITKKNNNKIINNITD
jgi:hypothetical protein